MKRNQPRELPPRPDGPARWVSRPPSGDAVEDRLAALIGAAEPPRDLGPAGRARVWSRLRRPAGPRRRLGAGLRWGVVVGVCLVSGAVIAAMSARRWWPSAAGVVAPVPRADRPRAPRPVAGQPDVSPVAEPPPPPEAPKADAPPRRIERVGAGRLEPRPVAPRPASSAVSAPSGETPLLGEAVARLRVRRDAPGALATLDVYRSRFPEGMLKREADAVRVDALLTLGRREEALAELRGVVLGSRGRDQELRVIRGELAAATDCRAAVDDFDRVLVDRAAGDLAERALHGRALCRLRLGDQADARLDLEAYLRRFPSGRFAAEARRIVAGARDGL